jgi:hypothetical protein
MCFCFHHVLLSWPWWMVSYPWALVGCWTTLKQGWFWSTILAECLGTLQSHAGSNKMLLTTHWSWWRRATSDGLSVNVLVQLQRHIEHVYGALAYARLGQRRYGKPDTWHFLQVAFAMLWPSLPFSGSTWNLSTCFLECGWSHCSRCIPFPGYWLGLPYGFCVWFCLLV